MLKRYATFVSLIRSVSDIFIIFLVWIFAYYIRFYSHIFSAEKSIPNFKRHLVLTLPIILICYLCCYFTGFYKPKRTQNLFLQLKNIFNAVVLSSLIILAFFYYLQDVPYSRKLLGLFIVFELFGLIFSHFTIMLIMQKLRSKGYNLRYYTIIGTVPTAIQLMKNIEESPWLGFKCAFFIDNNPAYIGTTIMNIPVYGPIEKLSEIVETHNVDEIYLAVKGDESRRAYHILKTLQYSGITIRIIPDWGDLASIGKITIIHIGSTVLFSAADSPLNGINIISKEVFDRIIALLLLIVCMVPMAFIALLIKISDKGPVFYKQKRIGIGRQEFEIIKFRTMQINNDSKNVAQWTKRNDVRCTRVGALLRRFSLDELPQFINVLKGEMSLVGPRPEQPMYAKQFSEEYKNYMLRHKIKTGMTGWAQIHDLRGDTSLKKRLLYDMYYVNNWSWLFDIWILLSTPWHILKGKNAY
ncbi:MAG: undecaprenyl-phosphate glucose phosphotransferase [Planctomycetes bacterium GWF2_41_51]|nr:MAG: undecaprenyl-phosphate glucose phosphotransferase [Planctomycetes bacterium GWF2_41_51]